MKATTILTAMAVILFSISLTAQRGGRGGGSERHEQRAERVMPRSERGNRGIQMRERIQERIHQMREQFQQRLASQEAQTDKRIDSAMQRELLKQRGQ